MKHRKVNNEKLMTWAMIALIVVVIAGFVVGAIWIHEYGGPLVVIFALFIWAIVGLLRK